MVTLESSLNSLKIALAQYGTSGAVGQTPTVLGVTANSAMATAAAPATPAISLTQSATKQLDMQRQLDSAYRAQAMLEVAGKANSDIMTRLKDLKKVTVKATDDKLAQSERAFLVSQFEGIRKNILSTAQNASWNGNRLFDGSAGSQRDGTLSFTVGSGSNGSVNISLPNLRADATRLSGLRSVQGSLGPGTQEQQTISLASATLADTTGTLTVGDLTLSSGTLGSDATLADLVAGFSSDANYAQAAFTLSDNGENGLAISWKTTGAVSTTAQLQLSATVGDSSTTSTYAATQTTAGSSPGVANGTKEVQQIAVRASAVAGRNVALRAGDYELFSGTLDSSTSITQLADALKASPRYSDAPFTISQEKSGYLTLTWKTAGSVTQVAALEVQPDAPLTSLLKRGGVGSATAAKSMSDAIDQAMKTVSDSATDLGTAGLQLTAAVQKIASGQSGAGASTSTAQASGNTYVNAISAMLRTQIVGNSSQATQAQANFTPQSVITTLQF